MIDIKLIRENRDLVKENIKKKFQDRKLPLVDEIYDYDIKFREAKAKCDNLKAEKNKLSAEIGNLMREGKKEKADEIKKKIAEFADEIAALEAEENKYDEEVKKRIWVIPNIIADDVPIGEDDSKNVDIEHIGEPIVPEYEIPYHADIMASFNGIDKEAAGRVA